VAFRPYLAIGLAFERPGNDKFLFFGGESPFLILKATPTCLRRPSLSLMHMLNGPKKFGNEALHRDELKCVTSLLPENESSKGGRLKMDKTNLIGGTLCGGMN
jgi:hypothetical protein